MKLPGLADYQFQAVDKYLRRCAVPILFKRNGQIGIHGTGSFLSAGQSLYLITASHVAQCMDENSVVPSGGNGGVLNRLGNVTVHRTLNTDNVDIAIVCLHDDRVAEWIQSEWTALGPSDLIDQVNNSRHFLIAGYPKALMKPQVHGLQGRWYGVVTLPYRGEESRQVKPWQLLLRYGKTAKKRGGRSVETERLHGMSGCPVWAECRVDDDALWSAEAQVKVCGIQVACKHDAYIETHRIGLIVCAMQDINPVAADELSAALKPHYENDSSCPQACAMKGQA